MGESYEIDILGGNSNVEILVIDVNNNNKRMGTARFDLSVSRGNCTTLWTQNQAGLPMCKKLDQEDAKGWDVELPLQGTSGKMRVTISPTKWDFEDGASANALTRKEPSTIVLCLIKARHLEGKDRGGTSDPYAVVKYGKHYTKKTTVIAKTTAPIWAETFVMERTHGRHGDVIGVEVFDKDKMVKSDSLGKCKINIRDLKYGQNVKEWKYLRSAVSGQIYYSVTHKKGLPSYISQKDLYADAGLGNTLVVNVIEAKNLIKADKDGDSDPYLILEYGQAKKKSDVVMDCLNPKFNFTALFPYNPQGRPMILTIKDWNKIGKAKNLGYVAINSRLDEGGSVEEWFQLQGVPTGQVLVQVYRTKNAEEGEGEGGKEGGPLGNAGEDGHVLVSSSPVEKKKSVFRRASIKSFKLGRSPRKVSMVE